MELRSKSTDAPTVVVGMDERDNQGKVIDQAELGSDCCLELPKFCCRVRGLKAVRVNEVPMEVGAVAVSPNVMKEFRPSREDLRASPNIVEESTTGNKWVARIVQLERKLASRDR